MSSIFVEILLIIDSETNNTKLHAFIAYIAKRGREAGVEALYRLSGNLEKQVSELPDTCQTTPMIHRSASKDSMVQLYPQSSL
jgi:hypothetical protein